jgi:hypothetical protein
MEYFLGSLFTLILMFFFSKKADKIAKQKLKTVSFSQSYINNLVEQQLIEELSSVLKPSRKTQASVYNEKQNVRVIIMENQAYWIVDQRLYVADMVDGTVDNDTTRVVDTMTMDDVELEKTQFIVQKLTEGIGNDSGYPRKP